MKTINIKLLLILLIFNLTSCKKENSTTSNLTYQYADQPQTINCSNGDEALLNEALYAFQNDIANFYDANQKNVIRAYNGFLRIATSNKKVALDEFVSEHSINIAKAINKTGIFNNNGLNYNHDIIKCAGENMSESGLKTTFNALISTNSMSRTLYEPALSGKASVIGKDNYLGLYIALEYFYSEIYKMDASLIDFEKRDSERVEKAKTPSPVNPNSSKVDFNKRPRK